MQLRKKQLKELQAQGISKIGQHMTFTEEIKFSMNSAQCVGVLMQREYSTTYLIRILHSRYHIKQRYSEQRIKRKRENSILMKNLAGFSSNTGKSIRKFSEKMEVKVV